MPDQEVCGLLLGSGDYVSQVVPTPNVAQDPACQFEIDPSALFAAIRTERSGGPALLGYYHSHPGGRPEPSRADAATSAGDGKLWLILADGKVAAWRATPGGFDPVVLEVC